MQDMHCEQRARDACGTRACASPRLVGVLSPAVGPTRRPLYVAQPCGERVLRGGGRGAGDCPSVIGKGRRSQ
eukprot:5836313-Alexandrium_andersonii.AAC.1